MDRLRATDPFRPYSEQLRKQMKLISCVNKTQQQRRGLLKWLDESYSWLCWLIVGLWSVVRIIIIITVGFIGFINWDIASSHCLHTCMQGVYDAIKPLGWMTLVYDIWLTILIRRLIQRLQLKDMLRYDADNKWLIIRLAVVFIYFRSFTIFCLI